MPSKFATAVQLVDSILACLTVNMSQFDCDKIRGVRGQKREMWDRNGGKRKKGKVLFFFYMDKIAGSTMIPSTKADQNATSHIVAVKQKETAQK